MGLLRRPGGTGGGAGHQSTVPTVVMLFLLAYFVGNVGMHLVRSFTGFGGDPPHITSVGTTAASVVADTTGVGGLLGRYGTVGGASSSLEGLEGSRGCNTIDDFIEDGDYESKGENPWRQMKWGLPPAKCRVNGHLIERLDPTYNYRRGVALRFTTDLDDKAHIEHWFLGTKVDFNLRKRRVFIDLGANYFQTSTVWFNQRYPCDFTEVHAFEIDPNMFTLPRGFDEESNRIESNEVGWYKIKQRNGYLPQWMIDRITPYNKFAGDADDEAANAINITRFIKEELKLTEHDAVIVKMDIEGSEWPILDRWKNDPEMPKIIDELWLELHYYHPDNNWLEVKEHSREEATRLLAEMRFKGFYVHYWD